MLSGSYSKRPTIELWGRALRWRERLRALANQPLFDDDFDFAVAWDVSDHAFALLGCCDAMRDWLLKSRPRLKVAVRILRARRPLRGLYRRGRRVPQEASALARARRRTPVVRLPAQRS
jgi:hypothetical protein